MKPHKSYIIWFTPRTGSTFLCNLLEKTGVAGIPGEYFLKEEHTSLLDHYQLQSYHALRESLWSKGSTSNGVMGMKYSLYAASFRSICAELSKLKNIVFEEFPEWELFADLFPDCRHIFLSRRNKMALVVSWWKAIQDNQWHIRKGDAQNQPAGFYDDKYDFNALLHLLKEHNLREAATQAFFSRNNIRPYNLFYEDLHLSPDCEVLALLKFLDIDPEPICLPSDPGIYKTSDRINEEWIDRFRMDLQRGWDKIIW